jgi:hypothetical protein
VIGLHAVADQFEGDYYDRTDDWDEDLPDIDAERSTDE